MSTDSLQRKQTKSVDKTRQSTTSKQILSLVRTKIIATLGPVSTNKKTLVQLVNAGVNLVRINMSHGTKEEHLACIKLVQEISKKMEKKIGILVDLQGPKIRINSFKEKQVNLKDGKIFILDPNLDPAFGTEKEVGIDYKNLANFLNKDDILLLDDGRISLKVTRIEQQKIYTKVEKGGVISANKGINKLGGGLAVPALTEKDVEDVLFVRELGIDYIAVSFVQSAKDILKINEILNSRQNFNGVENTNISSNFRINESTNENTKESIKENINDNINVKKNTNENTNANINEEKNINTGSNIYANENTKKAPNSLRKIGILAKIETAQALDNLEDIIKVSDAIIVARGDLGVEIGFSELPAIQKEIINKARDLDTVAITATQMMESMITNSIPTRAEVSDVANAILDGTDAVMLSAETAIGKYPVDVVETTSEICRAAEKQRATKVSSHRLDSKFTRVDEAVAMATMYTANHLGVKAIVALTETGSTPLMMSRIRSGIPIYGVTRSEEALGRMTLYRGVYPIYFDFIKYKRWQVVRSVLSMLRDNGIIYNGDKVIVTRGDVIGVSGGANTIKVLNIQDED